MSIQNKINCILLIDDDEINNFINKKLLEKLKVSDTIRMVNNGVEALEYINEYCSLNDKCCPELIFLDINMPLMDGFEFLYLYNDLVFKNKSKVRIVVLTTSSNPYDIEKIKNLGIVDYLNKPLTEEKLGKFFANQSGK